MIPQEASARKEKCANDNVCFRAENHLAVSDRELLQSVYSMQPAYCFFSWNLVN